MEAEGDGFVDLGILDVQIETERNGEEGSGAASADDTVSQVLESTSVDSDDFCDCSMFPDSPGKYISRVLTIQERASMPGGDSRAQFEVVAQRSTVDGASDMDGIMEEVNGIADKSLRMNGSLRIADAGEQDLLQLLDAAATGAGTDRTPTTAEPPSISSASQMYGALDADLSDSDSSDSEVVTGTGADQQNGAVKASTGTPRADAVPREGASASISAAVSALGDQTSQTGASLGASSAEEHQPPGDDPQASPRLPASKQAALLSLRAAFKSMASSQTEGSTGESPGEWDCTLEQLLGGEHGGAGRPVRSEAGRHAGDQAAASIEDKDEKALLDQLQSLASTEASVSVATAAAAIAASAASAATQGSEAGAPASADASAPDLSLPVVIEEQEQEEAVKDHQGSPLLASSTSQRYAVAAGEDAAGLPAQPASVGRRHTKATPFTAGTSADARPSLSDQSAGGPGEATGTSEAITVGMDPGFDASWLLAEPGAAQAAGTGQRGVLDLRDARDAHRSESVDVTRHSDQGSSMATTAKPSFGGVQPPTLPDTWSSGSASMGAIARAPRMSSRVVEHTFEPAGRFAADTYSVAEQDGSVASSEPPLPAGAPLSQSRSHSQPQSSGSAWLHDPGPLGGAPHGGALGSASDALPDPSAFFAGRTGTGALAGAGDGPAVTGREGRASAVAPEAGSASGGVTVGGGGRAAPIAEPGDDAGRADRSRGANKNKRAQKYEAGSQGGGGDKFRDPAVAAMMRAGLEAVLRGEA